MTTPELTPATMTDEHLAATLRETITVAMAMIRECANRGIIVSVMTTEFQTMGGFGYPVISIQVTKEL